MGAEAWFMLALEQHTTGRVLPSKRTNLGCSLSRQPEVLSFCQSLWGSGPGCQQAGSAEDKHTEKGERARERARTHALQTASDSLRTVATMVTLRLASASDKRSSMQGQINVPKSAGGLLSFVLPELQVPPGPPQTRPPRLHTEPLLSCIVV